MVNRYLERRFAINKNSSSSSSDARTGYQRCKHGPTDNQELTNSPCGASSCDDRRFYQKIKDLRTDVQAWTNSRSGELERHFGREFVFVTHTGDGCHHLLLEKLLSLLVEKPILLLLRSIALEKHPIAPFPILLILKFSALFFLRLLLHLLCSFFGISALVEVPRTHCCVPVHHVVTRGFPPIGSIVRHKAIGLKVGIAQILGIGCHLFHRGRIEIDGSAPSCSSHRFFFRHRNRAFQRHLKRGWACFRLSFARIRTSLGGPTLNLASFHLLIRLCSALLFFCEKGGKGEDFSSLFFLLFVCLFVC